MRATRALDEDALFDRARRFASEMVALGVTTIEAKSGYGLDVETELRLLRVYRRLGERGPARIVPTCLAAHVVPPEWAGHRNGYVDLIAGDVLPAVAAEGLADFVDVFVEDGAFTPEEARRICERGRALGLRPKLHVDQLTAGGGAELAAALAAVSADHLECVSETGIAALAAAVTLPLATMYLDQAPPPAQALIDVGVPVAVTTDFNPGTAPSYHLPLAMTLACTRQRMTTAEALKGATRYAARAVGLEGVADSLEPGSAADFALIDALDVEHWLYTSAPTPAPPPSSPAPPTPARSPSRPAREAEEATQLRRNLTRQVVRVESQNTERSELPEFRRYLAPQVVPGEEQKLQAVEGGEFERNPARQRVVVEVQPLQDGQFAELRRNAAGEVVLIQV